MATTKMNSMLELVMCIVNGRRTLFLDLLRNLDTDNHDILLPVLFRYGVSN